MTEPQQGVFPHGKGFRWACKCGKESDATFLGYVGAQNDYFSHFRVSTFHIGEIRTPWPTPS